MAERPNREGGERSHRPTDAMLLGALDRAARHRLPVPGPPPMRLLLEHLHIAPRSDAARELRGRLVDLRARGLVADGREHGVPVWSLTASGERALRAAGPQRLPESPRHLAWNRARTASAQELPRFRARLRATLDRAALMLAAAEPAETGAYEGRTAPTGREWLALGRALAGDCNRLGSAWHCLHEWPEPGDDAVAPGAPERARLAALRNIRLWREPD